MYRALYKGGTDLDLLTPKLIQAMSSEVRNPRQYQDRLKRARLAYTPHVSTCIDQARNQLFTYPIKIASLDRDEQGKPLALDPFYSDFAESCSTSGKSLQAFLAERFTQALVVGRAFWLVRVISSTEEVPTNMTVKEWKEAGFDRGWLEAVDAENILNWETDEHDELRWVVIHHCKEIQAGPFSPVMVQETWQHISRETIETYQVEYPLGKKPKDSQLIGSTIEANRFGRVPLVDLSFDDSDLALMPRAHRTQIHHWDLATGFSLATARTQLPRTVLNSDMTPSPEDSERAASDAHIRIGTEDKISYLSPNADSFESQRELLKDIKRDIYTLCHFAGYAQEEPKERARSGAAREIDSGMTESALQSFGIAVKEAAQKTFNLLALVRQEPPRFDITGLDTFTVAIKGMTIEAATSLLNLDLPSSLKREVKKVLRQKVLPGVAVTVAEEIDQEISMENDSPPVDPPSHGSGDVDNKK